ERLFPLISYTVQKSTDFSILEREGRAKIQGLEDRANELQEALEQKQKEAEAVLAAIRKVAAEQGVSQQAIYFKQEADAHEQVAKSLLKQTIWMSVGLGLYACLSLGLHKVPYLVLANAYVAVQLAVSKVMIFATISFFLFLAARNFTANRHNAVVNRHRHTAL